MGEPISALPPLVLPVQPTDWLEVSRLEEGAWRSYKCSALAITVGQATTTVAGIAELATKGETIAGIDPDRVVTPEGIDAMIKDVLQNRIIAGAGIVLSYESGTLTISTGAGPTYQDITVAVSGGGDESDETYGYSSTGGGGVDPGVIESQAIEAIQVHDKTGGDGGFSFAVSLDGTLSQDFFYTVSDNRSGVTRTSSSAAFEVSGGNSIWTWTTADAGGWDSLGGLVVTFSFTG